MSTFKYALMACGLTAREASDYFEACDGRHISKETIHQLMRGRGIVRPELWGHLARLYDQIDASSVDASERFADMPENHIANAFQNCDVDLGEDAPAASEKIAGAKALLLWMAETK